MFVPFAHTVHRGSQGGMIREELLLRMISLALIAGFWIYAPNEAVGQTTNGAPVNYQVGVSPGTVITDFNTNKAMESNSVGEPLDAHLLAGEWSLKKEVNEVDVLFTATRNGKPVGNLVQSNILIRDDDQLPAAVTAFRTHQELPLRVGLLVDTSDSVTSRFSFEKAAAGGFLRQALTGKEDLGFVLGFSDHLRLTQDFVGDADLLAQGVERLSLQGGTALYDAVLAACRKLHDRQEQDIVARVLVVMSDGQNNAGKTTLVGAIDAAQEAGVTIYAIGTNYTTYSIIEENREAELGKANLRKLSEQTGGRALFPPDPKEVGRAFGKIDEELRNRYEVSYTPADFKADGRYRKIKIEAKGSGKGLEIRARKGYFARGRVASRTGENPVMIHD